MCAHTQKRRARRLCGPQVKQTHSPRSLQFSSRVREIGVLRGLPATPLRSFSHFLTHLFVTSWTQIVSQSVTQKGVRQKSGEKQVFPVFLSPRFCLLLLSTKITPKHHFWVFCDPRVVKQQNRCLTRICVRNHHL